MDTEDRKRSGLSPTHIDALATSSSTSLSVTADVPVPAWSPHRRSITDVTSNAIFAAPSTSTPAGTSRLSPTTLAFQQQQQQQQQQLSHGQAQQSVLTHWSHAINASDADPSMRNIISATESDAPVKHEYSHSFESSFMAQMSQSNLSTTIPTVDEPSSQLGNGNQKELEAQHGVGAPAVYSTDYSGLPSHAFTGIDGHSSPISRPPSQQLSHGFTGSQPIHGSNLMVEASYPDWRGIVSQSSAHGHHRAPSEYSDVSSVWSHANSYTNAQESFEIPDQTTFQFPGVGDAPIGDNNVDDYPLSDSRGLSPVPSLFTSTNGMDFSQPENPFYIADPQSQEQHSSSHVVFPSGAHTPIHLGTPQPINSAQPSEESAIAPPSIHVVPAGPSRKSSFEPEADPDADPMPNADSLSIPHNRSSRARSHSDPYGQPKNKTLSPAPSAALTPSRSTLSPGSSPRSLSPTGHVQGRGRGRPRGSSSSAGSRDTSASDRRQSTSSVENRNYILDLADPQRPRSTSDSRRVQKHPATFQCSICPKRFTRAYNLRSHLRTHTDDRPFECTVCGKAFARQHDRKRHEELHSGEKKFVCSGDLASGGKWGCGRRFARADALGRHLKSEVGRLCVKPLLDEEIADDQQKRATCGPQQHNKDKNTAQTGDGNLVDNSIPLERNLSALGHNENQLLRPRSSPHHARSVSQPVYSASPNQGNQQVVNNPSTNALGIPAVLFAQYPDLQYVDFNRFPESSNALSPHADAVSDVGSTNSFYDGGVTGEDDMDYDGYLSGNSRRSSIFGGSSSPAHAASPIDYSNYTDIAAASSTTGVHSEADLSPGLHGTESWGTGQPPF